MKNRILFTIASVLTLAPFAHALPEQSVPESGSTLGAVAVAALAIVALRRKLTK
ncbi:MAG TPA: hypothetical protein VG734_07310 [Lacunisphaera sp.]|nr:hypothetical protein [Lacunisphaera sp.]